MAKKKEPSDPTKIKLQPLGDRVVVERDESETVTAGGIVLPDTAKDKPTRGKIVSVGDGRLLDNGTRSPSRSRSATASCSRPTPATPSSSAPASCCCCAKKTFWPSSNITTQETDVGVRRLAGELVRRGMPIRPSTRNKFAG